MLFAAVCVVIAFVVVMSVVLFVRSQNRKLAAAKSVSRRWQAHATAAQHTALLAREEQANAVRLASDAVARTGQALEVRQEIERLADQMEVLMGVVVPRHAQHQVPRHPRRHIA
jgi:hypothetical protein